MLISNTNSSSNSLLSAAILLVAFILFSCDSFNKIKIPANAVEARILKGKILAAQYCQSCHALPDPSLLDVESWRSGVLPNMGPLLGIFIHNSQYYPAAKNDPYLDSNYYPSQPLVTPDEWQNIIDYYVSSSPDSLSQQSHKNLIKRDLTLFEAQFPSLKYDSAAVSFIKIDNTSPMPGVTYFDVLKQQIFRFDVHLQLANSKSYSGNIVDMEFINHNVVACDIGILNPTNGKFGKGLMLSRELNWNFKSNSLKLFGNLARPVQLTTSDLNLDGRMDYIVCEFGNFTGSLLWMENAGNNEYVRHELKAQPGAIKVYVNDYNKDGLPDLWALFTQGNESIVLFTNKGKGKFDQREVLRFPAVYGSTYFEMSDFNNDGKMDIIYTCGDNADYSMVLKPYHGVYIFLNDGNLNFKQKYFFPINGCFKAVPRDYDNDGDIDIAAIAFFADYVRRPEEGFVYLENKNDFRFEPHTFPGSTSGRWLTMDAGDFDGDERIDIVLGNFSIRPTAVPTEVDWKKGPPFIVLKNIGK